MGKHYYDNQYIFENREEALQAYFKKINNHRKNIQKAFDKYGERLAKLYKIDIKELTHNITEHDMSKLRNNDEINGYIAHFFPYKDDGLPLVNYGLRRCIYEKGLLSHYHNNQHHPEYWVVIRDNTLSPTPMRKLYVAEMLIDWIANQSDGRLPVKEFWKMDRSRKFIHHDTIIDIDRGVDSLDDNDNDLELINTSFKLIDMSKG